MCRKRDSAYLAALRDSPLAEALRNGVLEFEWGNAEVIYDDPAKITSDRALTDLRITARLKPYTDRIAEQLIIFSPYFVPGKKGVAKLRELRERGVRVRILTFECMGDRTTGRAKAGDENMHWVG